MKENLSNSISKEKNNKRQLSAICNSALKIDSGRLFCCDDNHICNGLQGGDNYKNCPLTSNLIQCQKIGNFAPCQTRTDPTAQNVCQDKSKLFCLWTPNYIDSQVVTDILPYNERNWIFNRISADQSVNGAAACCDNNLCSGTNFISQCASPSVGIFCSDVLQSGSCWNISNNIPFMNYQVETCSGFTSNSPIASSTLANSVISTFASSSSTFVNPVTSTPNDTNLAEKIAIPVGTVAGVTTIGLVSYLIYKKKRKKPLLISGDRERRIAEISNSDEGTQEVINEREKENSSRETAVTGSSRSQSKEDNEQLRKEMKKLKARLERVEQNQGLEAQIEQPPK